VIKLDIGCGKNKAKSIDEYPFIGIDCIAFDGVDLVADLSQEDWRFKGAPPDHGEKVPCSGYWRFKDGVVGEVYSCHFLEHLTGAERVAFFNELYRVMKPGAKALIITPDWSNACAYGDPTHQWPPISSWYALYLNKQWRDQNAPYVGYTCDFDWVHGAGMEQWLLTRPEETRMFAMQHYINSSRDLHITLTKTPR